MLTSLLSNGATFSDRLDYGFDHMPRMAVRVQCCSSCHRIIHFDANSLAEYRVPDSVHHSFGNAPGYSRSKIIESKS
jgi:hypothetical protein